MVFGLGFGNIHHHMIFELARGAQPLAAAAGALRQLHFVLLDLLGRDFLQLGRLAKLARMLPMPLRPPILFLGSGRGFAVRLRLVPLALQPLHLGFQLRHPRFALGELRFALGELRFALGELPLQLRDPHHQRGHPLSKCYDIFHDAHNLTKISFPAKSSLA